MSYNRTGDNVEISLNKFLELIIIIPQYWRLWGDFFLVLIWQQKAILIGFLINSWPCSDRQIWKPSLQEISWGSMLVQPDSNLLLAPRKMTSCYFQEISGDILCLSEALRHYIMVRPFIVLQKQASGSVLLPFSTTCAAAKQLWKVDAAPRHPTNFCAALIFSQQNSMLYAAFTNLIHWKFQRLLQKIFRFQFHSWKKQTLKKANAWHQEI